MTGGFREAVRDHRRNRSPLLAFNVVDTSSLQGVVAASTAVDAPVIVQFSARTVAFYGVKVIRDTVTAAAGAAGVECFLHLDHCSDDALLGSAIEGGFDGVMADGSHLSFDANVHWTRRWCDRGHAEGVLVEGELGAVPGSEDGRAGGPAGDTPDVETYLDFADRTKVDLLGANIGTIHGRYERPPSIQFALLENLAPLDGPGFVVHGCSGLDASTLGRLVDLRAVKLNFSTDLKQAWARAVTAALAGPASSEPLGALTAAKQAVAEMAREKWRFCGMEA